jgi:hypothetical protein
MGDLWATTVSETSRERLAVLRAKDHDVLAPFWIESLPAAEAVIELHSRPGGIYRLQEARFLLTLDRIGEARMVLGELADLPPGLASIRNVLLEELRRKGAGIQPNSRPTGRSGSVAPGTADTGLASITLAELYATQGEVGAALAVYERLLAAAPHNESLRRRVDDLQTGRLSRASPRPTVSLAEAEHGEPALLEWLDRVMDWRRALGV